MDLDAAPTAPSKQRRISIRNKLENRFWISVRPECECFISVPSRTRLPFASNCNRNSHTRAQVFDDWLCRVDTSSKLLHPLFFRIFFSRTIFSPMTFEEKSNSALCEKLPESLSKVNRFLVFFLRRSGTSFEHKLHSYWQRTRAVSSEQRAHIAIFH